MKRFFSILFFFFSVASFSQSSNYWLQAAGSPNVDENLGISKDNSGNIITVGYFTNTITFPNLSTLTSTSSGVSDALIQKTNALGQLVWAVKAGGMASDRAIAVTCDATGNIYITGYYFGTAQFGSITLNSVSNTQDVFIAKLNSSGTFLWAKSAGGNLAEDPYAINVDQQGNVIVTGEFQGTATFGTQTITSMINTSGNSSFDVFTVKYDNSGNFLWVRQGSAKFDDRGLDVGTDASGNVFVCGQFSDTIMFNQIHNNQIMNAVFIIKYSPSGQELWFVRAGATSSIAYGLAVDNNNDVYVTGDYTGNIIFYGIPNNFLFGSYSNRIFLVKYSNAGNYLWGKEDASNSYVSSKDVALNANEEPCIYGEFDCKMDEYSVAAGGTGMFNSIGFHDLFITQYDKNGNRQWFRNFGGPYDDKSHGITFTNNLTPYVAGSFNYKLFVNSIYNSTVLPLIPGFVDYWISSINCNNSSSYYYGTYSAGFSDCFIMHCVDNTCAYYDYYYRSGGGCQQDFVGGCVDGYYTYNCPDTIKICGPGDIYANTHTGTIGGVAPFYHYQWNTGDTMSYHNVTSSGNYSCVMTTIDGCFTTEDTVYAKVNPFPLPPTITDNLGINVNQPPTTFPIIICGTGTFTLTGGNLQGCSYLWTGPGIISTSGPSCVVNQAGTYNFTITNAFGCSNTNWIIIQFQTIDHVVPITNEPDTFITCGCIHYFVFDSLTNPTGLPYNCFTSLTSVISSNAQVSGNPNCIQPDDLSLDICPTATGWINFSIKYMFNSLCGKDSAFFNKSVYIILKPTPPPPNITININGNTNLCPGDSSLMVATFTVTPLTNVTYTLSGNDSAWVHPGGCFSFYVNATDTLGCWSNNNNYSYLCANVKPNPYIYTIPANGIICPNDSVKIICTFPGAVSWQWYGPSGLLPGSSSFIYQSIPGFYYCVATDNNGCTLTSNTIEIKMYNTPYLIALPQTVVCAGQTITLQVISSDTTLIQWLPPLSGGGTIRNVTTGGTYSCQVTMCGITTLCNITVVVSQPVAQISTVGSLTICPGDSVLLVGNSGMAAYLWLPTNQLNDSIYAYAAGTYVLIATDGNGCQAIDSIVVNYNPNAPPQPVTTNDSICYGNVANLSASTTGNYTIEWYLQQYSGSIINTGTNYTTPVLYQNTSYYVSVKDSVGCHSVRQIANVFIIPTSIPPLIWGDTLLCFGDTLNLYTNYLGGAAYSWSGPNSFTSSVINPQISPVTVAATGTYSLFISGSGCTSPTVTHAVIIVNLAQPAIVTTDTLCQGSSLVLQGSSIDTGVVYNWTGPGGFSASTQTCTINPADTSNTGIYLLQTTLANCKSEVDTVYVLVKPTPNPNAYELGGSCFGDSANLYSQTLVGASTVWTGPSGYSSNQPNIVIANLNMSNTGYYYLTSTLNGCTGKDSVKVNVHALPYFSLGNDTLTCSSTPLFLYPGHFTYYLWNNSITDTSFTVQGSGQITLTVSNQYGCKYSDTLNVIVAECYIKAPNVFTPNGDGINDTYYFLYDHYMELEILIYDRWGVLVYQNANNANGWDGYNMFTKKPVTDGTYYYIATSTNIFGKKAADHGFISLFR